MALIYLDRHCSAHKKAPRLRRYGCHQAHQRKVQEPIVVRIVARQKVTAQYVQNGAHQLQT